MRRLFLIPFALAGATLFAACGPDATPTPEPVLAEFQPEGAEKEYLLEIQGAREMFEGRMAAIGDAIDSPAFQGLLRTSTDEIKEMILFEELRNLDIEEVEAEIASVFAAIEPPPGYEADHKYATERLYDLAGFAANFTVALEEEDLLGVAMYATRHRAMRAEIAANSSPGFCAAFAAGPENRFCDPPPGTIPGGEYGESAYRIVKRWSAGFGPRASLQLNVTDYALVGGLKVVQPEIEALFIETIDDLKALQPLPELQEGHDVLVNHFESLLEVAYEIDAAIEADDIDGVYAAMASSGDVANASTEAMPSEYCLIAQLALDCG